MLFTWGPTRNWYISISSSPFQLDRNYNLACHNLQEKCKNSFLNIKRKLTFFSSSIDRMASRLQKSCGSSLFGSWSVNIVTIRRFQSFKCCIGLCSDFSWSSTRHKNKCPYEYILELHILSYAKNFFKRTKKLRRKFKHKRSKNFNCKNLWYVRLINSKDLKNNRILT